MQVLDLSETPVPGLRFAIYNQFGKEIGSTCTSSEKDGNISGKVSSFGLMQNTNEETMNGYGVEMNIFYYHSIDAYKPENKGRSLEIIGGSKRWFENNTDENITYEYIVYVNELNGKPAAVVMYNMTAESLNLSNQSKETSERSLYLSKWALGITIFSLLIAGVSLFMAIKMQDIKNRRQQFKYRYNDSKDIIYLQWALLALLIIAIIIAAILRVRTEGYGLWTLDTVIEVIFGFLLLTFIMNKFN